MLKCRSPIFLHQGFYVCVTNSDRSCGNSRRCFAGTRRNSGTFFKLLPRNTSEAAQLAKKHNDKLKGRAWTKTDKSRPIRYAIEIRHDSFMVPEFFLLLRKHRMAFVFSDAAVKWPYAEDLTTDFVYCRLHGAEELYASGYDDRAIAKWARQN